MSTLPERGVVLSTAPCSSQATLRHSSYRPLTMETDCTRDDLPVNGVTAPLPAGTRLLHIGPHKTGTTSVQGALFAARDLLPEHGVVFPAHSRHPMEAVLAACARPAMMGDTAPTEKHWTRLLEQVRATCGKTSVISSEFFADTEDDDTIARIVGQLGGERVHVLVTLRPLVRIMPSQWQQYVQNGLRMGYEDWLTHMLRKAPYEQPNPSFWRRHRHDRLVERWVRAVGAQRVTVVVVDDRTAHGEEDHSGPLVTELLGEAGFLVDGVGVVSADGVEIRNALNTAVIGGVQYAGLRRL